jgi:hypothetical protein
MAFAPGVHQVGKKRRSVNCQKTKFIPFFKKHTSKKNDRSALALGISGEYPK